MTPPPAGVVAWFSVGRMPRRRWSVLFDVLWWLGLCALLALERVVLTPRVWEMAAGLLLVTVAVGSSRVLPVLSLAVGASSGLVLLLDYGNQVPAWPMFLMVSASYFAGRRMEYARPALAVFGAVVVAGVPVALLISRDAWGSWGELAVAVVFAALCPWLLGRHVRLRAQLARTGWERAEEMESRQRMVAEQAKLRERARIASDMHDSLGHELSLIAVRAAGLEVAGGLDEDQRRAAGELRESAAVATDRLRQILGVLREDAAPTEPVHESLVDLLDRARASGMVIESVFEAVPDVVVSPMVSLAVYRVVQESLTNVAKHAPGAAVTVAVSRSAEETTVSVVNARPPAGPLPGASSGRRGLIGLRERVRLVGGALSAEPRDGGFAVTVTLPHDAAPVVEVPETVDKTSESAQALAKAQRQVRRSLLLAVFVPVLLFAGVIGISGILYVFHWYDSQLAPGDYERLKIGQSRTEIEGMLPAEERATRPYRVSPAGESCEFYGTDHSVFSFDYQVYRLCFAGGRLAHKDVIGDEQGEHIDSVSTG